MRVLTSRVSDHDRRQAEAELDSLRASRQEGRGHQIRTYSEVPSKRVRDERTGYRTSDLDGILAGNIGDMLLSYARHIADQRRHSPEPHIAAASTVSRRTARPSGTKPNLS